jgi:hypothetical protein
MVCCLAQFDKHDDPTASCILPKACHYLQAAVIQDSQIFGR